jgi:hypothetical protein
VAAAGLAGSGSRSTSASRHCWPCCFNANDATAALCTRSLLEQKADESMPPHTALAWINTWVGREPSAGVLSHGRHYRTDCRYRRQPCPRRGYPPWPPWHRLLRLCLLCLTPRLTIMDSHCAAGLALKLGGRVRDGPSCSPTSPLVVAAAEIWKRNAVPEFRLCRACRAAVKRGCRVCAERRSLTLSCTCRAEGRIGGRCKRALPIRASHFCPLLVGHPTLHLLLLRRRR